MSDPELDYLIETHGVGVDRPNDRPEPDEEPYE